jgi:hypothetical protein
MRIAMLPAAVSAPRRSQLYETLSKEEREKIPQALRVWLRYRSEKYFGEGR